MTTGQVVTGETTFGRAPRQSPSMGDKMAFPRRKWAPVPALESSRRELSNGAERGLGTNDQSTGRNKTSKRRRNKMGVARARALAWRNSVKVYAGLEQVVWNPELHSIRG